MTKLFHPEKLLVTRIELCNKHNSHRA